LRGKAGGTLTLVSVMSSTIELAKFGNRRTFFSGAAFRFIEFR